MTQHRYCITRDYRVVALIFMPVAEISRCGNQDVGLARFLILNSFKLLDVYL